MQRSFNDTVLYFHKNYISIENPNYSGHYNDHIIMHDCEHPIMKEHAKICTENGGDILEIGFGMGICSDYIQNHNIKTHTIIESHPQIADRAREWALDKTNVTIIEDTWQNAYNKNKLKTYDGIMFDPSEFEEAEKMFDGSEPIITKPGCILTYYNGLILSQIINKVCKLNENPKNLNIPGTKYYAFKFKQDTLFDKLHQGDIYWMSKKVF